MNNKLRILSIDGGGIKGIIPAVVLNELENRIKQKTGNSEAKLSDYFDLIAGTSVGGIIACLLLIPDKNGKPLFSGTDILDLFLYRGKEFFKKTPLQNCKSFFGLNDERYPNTFVEKIIYAYLDSFRLSQLLKPSLITSYDIEKRKAIFFTSHDAKLNNNYDFYVKDVARATSAAPTYFEPAFIKSFSNTTYPLIDGGIFANNPAMCAFVESFKLNKDLTPENIMIFSCGTGISKKSFPYTKFKDTGLTGWAKPLFDIIMSSSEETVDYELNKIFTAACAEQNYLRVNISLDGYNGKVFELDNAAQENIDLLKNIGSECALKFDKEMDIFADMIIT
jgi:patatin-like phospholipase/acyl hydrolase